MQRISSEAFMVQMTEDPEIQILDVRTAVECRVSRLRQPHQTIPLDRIIDGSVPVTVENPEKPLYVLCRTDNRSQQAANILEQRGLRNLVVVDGGMSRCGALGVELIKEGAMSLERQVRIAAGILVLLGVLLGAYASPVFYLLSAFVGGGLIFAGLTDWCGMALLLAKAPWNK